MGGQSNLLLFWFGFGQGQMYNQIQILFVKNRGHGSIILLEMFWYPVFILNTSAKHQNFNNNNTFRVYAARLPLPAEREVRWMCPPNRSSAPPFPPGMWNYTELLHRKFMEKRRNSPTTWLYSSNHLCPDSLSVITGTSPLACVIIKMKGSLKKKKECTGLRHKGPPVLNEHLGAVGGVSRKTLWGWLRPAQSNRPWEMIR